MELTASNTEACKIARFRAARGAGVDSLRMESSMSAFHSITGSAKAASVAFISNRKVMISFLGKSTDKRRFEPGHLRATRSRNFLQPRRLKSIPMKSFHFNGYNTEDLGFAPLQQPTKGSEGAPVDKSDQRGKSGGKQKVHRDSLWPAGLLPE